MRKYSNKIVFSFAEGDLNFLLYTALDKVSFLPTGYLFELWRWGLFSGEIKPEEMNTKWWELR